MSLFPCENDRGQCNGSDHSRISSSLCWTRESSMSFENDAHRAKSGELSVRAVTGKWVFWPAISSCDQYVTASSRFICSSATNSFKSFSDETSKTDGLNSLFLAQWFAAVAVDSGISFGESFCCRRISSRSFCIIAWAFSRHCLCLSMDRGPLTPCPEEAMAFGWERKMTNTENRRV